MTLDRFLDLWNELGDEEKANIYINYQSQMDSDKIWWNFDDEFFETFFSDKMEVCRATFFGHIESWNDEYIRFNGYGNLESAATWKVAEEADEYVEDIYDHEECWGDYIEDDEDGE